jgi:4-amino-4-deoxy-L-arabinose transferase-like glycosyltransferase
MRSPVAATAFVVGLAMVTRLAAAVVVGDGFRFDDEAVYLDAATRIASGAGFGRQYGSVPAYPLVVAALRAMAPAGVLGIRVAQAVVTAVGVAVVLALAGALFGRRAALAAGLLYALDPLLVVAGVLLYPEAVAAVLLAAAVLTALRAARHDDLGRSAIVGIACGLLALLRPVALVLVPVIAAWIAVVVAGPVRRRAWHATLVLAGCGLALVPWTYRNYRLRGDLVPIARAGTHTAPVPLSEVHEYGLSGALLREMALHPSSIAVHVEREFLHFWELYPQRLTTDNAVRRADIHENDPRLPTDPPFPAALRDRVSAVASVAEIGLALMGLGVLWRHRRAEGGLLVAVMLAFGLGYALFIGKMRYRIPIVPMVLVLAGAGATRILGAESDRAEP